MMIFKPSKSRSLVLEKEKVVNNLCLTISEAIIHFLTEKSVKSLDCILKLLSTQNIADLDAWVTKADKSGLLNCFNI